MIIPSALPDFNPDFNQDPYASLKKVLDMALDQAANGKGKERHVFVEDQPFEQQDICEYVRIFGHGFTRGQASKKIKESARMNNPAAIRELLGAINYLAADIIIMLEESDS